MPLSAFTQGTPRAVGLGTTGYEIVKLTMAAYLSAERGSVVDLTDAATLAELDEYVPAIQRGEGSKVLSME